VAQRICAILLSDNQSKRWSTRAHEQLKTQRQELGGLADQCGHIWRDSEEDCINWTTFAGSALNGVIGRIVEARLSLEATWDDFEISLPPTTDVAAVRALAAELLSAPNLAALIPANQELIDQLKFSTCLPNALAQRATQGRLDLSPLKEVLAAVIRFRASDHSNKNLMSIKQIMKCPESSKLDPL
jgi:hypothetical protein